MKYGFIKTAAATPKIKVADTSYNTKQILKMIYAADELRVKLLVLPELCITSYTCGDLFQQASLQKGVLDALEQLTEVSHGMSMLIAVGAPLVKDQKLYNCAVIIYNGKVLGVVPKKNLPNYTEFYEARYFTPAPAENSTIQLGEVTCPFGSKLLFRAEEMPEFTAAFEICEDLWVPAPPSISHATAGATIIGNLSASNETVSKENYRRQLVAGQSARLLCGYVYASAGEGESTTDMVYAGHNVIAENGAVLEESQRFEVGVTISEIDVFRMESERRRMNTFPVNPAGYQVVSFDIPIEQSVLTRFVSAQPFIPFEPGERYSRCKEILELQAHGLKKRIKHTEAGTVVLGLSGGLDSTLALIVAVKAMELLNRPHTDIIAVTMPCFGTSGRTKNNAVLIAEAYGVALRTIPIDKAVRQHFEDIGHNESVHDVTYENAQARERTQVLMDLANEHNGLVIGTGDLSELALGWATYNGDQMSMYGVNASIPKTLVRYLVAYEAEHTENAHLKEVLNDILDTPVSPELLPVQDGEIVQKTEDIVGPYELHDFFLYYILRFGFSPTKVYYLALYAFEDRYTQEIVMHWLRTFYRRFFAQQFKRSSMPDGVKVGSVTLSPRGDWRMPSDASAALWLEELAGLAEKMES